MEGTKNVVCVLYLISNVMMMDFLFGRSALSSIFPFLCNWDRSKEVISHREDQPYLDFLCIDL